MRPPPPALLLAPRAASPTDPSSPSHSLSIRTNQPALHLFTTPSRPWGLPYPVGLARKASHLPHGKAPEQCTAEERAYPKGGAVAIECEGLVDAVHHAGEDGWGDPVRATSASFSVLRARAWSRGRSLMAMSDLRAVVHARAGVRVVERVRAVDVRQLRERLERAGPRGGGRASRSATVHSSKAFIAHVSSRELLAAAESF